MFPFWLIMLALSRPSPNNSILPWPRSCKYSGISPITNKTIQQKYAAWKGEKWETYVWILHVKSVASKGMICIVWPKHAVSSHGTSKVKRKNKVGGDISRRDGITILLSKPKKKTQRQNEWENIYIGQKKYKIFYSCSIMWFLKIWVGW